MAAFWLAYYTGKRVIRSRAILVILLALPVVGTVAGAAVPSAPRIVWLCGLWAMSALLAAGVTAHIRSVDGRTGMADVVAVSVLAPSVQFWAHAMLFAAMLGGQLIISLLMAIFV
jgi:hypothetical protein